MILLDLMRNEVRVGINEVFAWNKAVFSKLIWDIAFQNIVYGLGG